MGFIDRQKITCVRCPALSGVMVTEAACKGLKNNQNEQEIKRCPYYKRDSGDTLQCTYLPNNPKPVSSHNLSEEQRSGVVIEGKHQIQISQIFAVHVHAGVIQGSQYEAATVNIT